jgi:pimeloyl-ACP methyl ester carboxylesterase
MKLDNASQQTITQSPRLKYRMLGQGPKKILITHDFFSDTTSYEAILPYLQLEACTYVFVDLRGYGLNKAITGTYTVEEVANDLISVANDLNWDAFQAIGHSMTGQFIQYMAYAYPKRVKSLIAITPVPPCGSKMPDEIAEKVTSAAKGDTLIAESILSMIIGERMAKGFIQFKVKRWYETSTEAARLGYLKAFTQTDFSNKIHGLQIPIRVITGEFDLSYSAAALKENMLIHYPSHDLRVVPNSSHYPIQESPPYLTRLMEDFYP